MEGRKEDKMGTWKTGRISVRTSGAGGTDRLGESQREVHSSEPVRPKQQRAAARNVHDPADSGGSNRDLHDMPQEEKLNAVYRLTRGLVQQMEKARIAEYTELLNSPLRLIWLNILSGVARGLGIALGFTFFAATIIYVLQVLGALNLPIIGDYIADIVRIVQHQLELKTF